MVNVTVSFGTKEKIGRFAFEWLLRVGEVDSSACSEAHLVLSAYSRVRMRIMQIFDLDDTARQQERGSREAERARGAEPPRREERWAAWEGGTHSRGCW